MTIRLTRSIDELTASFLKQVYLGIELVDQVTGQPLPDEFYDTHIALALAKFQDETNIIVQPTDIFAEKHDYSIQDYVMFAFFGTYKAPLIQVYQMRAHYPSSELSITTFPKEWIKLQQPNQLQLVPTAGTLSQVLIGQAGSYLPLIFTGIGYLPQLFQVDYQAGFPEGEVPLSIFDAIAKMATISAFTAKSDSVYPVGLSSFSVGIDGLSQSFGIVNNGQLPAVFASRIGFYRMELYGAPGKQGFLDQLSLKYFGIPMAVA